MAECSSFLQAAAGDLERKLGDFRSVEQALQLCADQGLAARIIAPEGGKGGGQPCSILGVDLVHLPKKKKLKNAAAACHFQDQ